MDNRLSVSPSLLPVPQPMPASQSPSTSSMSMPLPPEAIYSSQKELYTSIQAWAAQYHYAFRIERSKKIHNGIRTKVLYSCDRAGRVPPQSSLHRKRQTATRKTGCQFSITAIERTDGQWELRYRPGVEYNIHNHPPSQSTSSHPVHRKLSQVEINQARSLHNAGT